MVKIDYKVLNEYIHNVPDKIISEKLNIAPNDLKYAISDIKQKYQITRKDGKIYKKVKAPHIKATTPRYRFAKDYYTKTNLSVTELYKKHYLLYCEQEDILESIIKEFKAERYDKHIIQECTNEEISRLEEICRKNYNKNQMDFETFFMNFLKSTKFNVKSLNICNWQYNLYLNRIINEYRLVREENMVMIFTDKLPIIKKSKFEKDYYYSDLTIQELLKKYSYDDTDKPRLRRKLWRKYGVLRWKKSKQFFRKATPEELKEFEKKASETPKILTKDILLRVLNKHLKTYLRNIMQYDNEIRLEKDNPHKKELYREHLVKKRIEIAKKDLINNLKEELL